MLVASALRCSPPKSLASSAHTFHASPCPLRYSYRSRRRQRTPWIGARRRVLRCLGGGGGVREEKDGTGGQGWSTTTSTPRHLQTLKHAAHFASAAFLCPPKHVHAANQRHRALGALVTRRPSSGAALPPLRCQHIKRSSMLSKRAMQHAARQNIASGLAPCCEPLFIPLHLAVHG